MLIEFLLLEKLYIGTGQVLGYYVQGFKSWDGFRLFFLHSFTSLNTEPIDARGAAASKFV